MHDLNSLSTPIHPPCHSLLFLSGSFAVQMGIICVPGSFAVLGSFAVQFGDHLRTRTDPLDSIMCNKRQNVTHIAKKIWNGDRPVRCTLTQRLESPSCALQPALPHTRLQFYHFLLCSAPFTLLIKTKI